MNKRRKCKQRCEVPQQNTFNEVTALRRRMDAIFKLNIFKFGSIWAVGEALWQHALPLEYAMRESGREMHPGLCIKPPNVAMISTTVMMLFGTHSRSRRNRMFNVQNLWGDGDTSFSYFGAFPPVGLDAMAYGNDDSEIRTHIRLYKRQMCMLSPGKRAELRRFLHDVYSWKEGA